MSTYRDLLPECLPLQNLSTRAEPDYDVSDADTLADETNDDFYNKSDNDDSAEDPFKPFDDLPAEDRNILTVRAVIVGILCGALVNASNIYLGLKSGWTTSANIFASVIGFTVLKSCANYANYIPFLGGDFGPRENNIVQTTATAAGGMSNVFVSAFPALYQLGLMKTPVEDFWGIATLTAVGGYFGFFFATPLRKFFIIYVARDLGLIFPSSYATATTIRSMHRAAEGGSSDAHYKVQALIKAFSFSMVLRVVSQYALGILWDWHPLTWLYLVSDSQRAIDAESWGWFIEWTPAFIGSGMLVGMNVAISYMIGSVLAWGIIGPMLVSRGFAFGLPATNDPAWSGYISYFSLAEDFATAHHPSPRYWLLWPGILCLVTVSMTELICQWRIFWLSAQAVWKAAYQYLSFNTRKSTLDAIEYEPLSKQKRLVEDSALESDQVKMWMWLPGLVSVLLLTCIVMNIQYSLPVAETCLALILAFFFSFLAIQATDITPLTGASKASQIVLGSATKTHHWSIPKSQTLNLLGGAITSVGANQATDLTGDFRVGFLLRTSPKLQWFAQGLGTLFAIFIAPSIFVLFATAYPCINDAAAASCPFQTPSVSAWRAVAVAVTDETVPIPISSRNFAIAFACFGAAMALVRHTLWTGRWEWVRGWHPNTMVMSLAFVIPATVYSSAMLMGAIGAAIWAKRRPMGFNTYGYAVAAGLMAGEGIGGVLNAVLQILGLSGDVWGAQVGCPGGRC